MGAGGCRCSGRSRQAAGRCRCHRLDVAAVDTGGLIRRAWVAAAALFCGRRWARSGHHQVTIEDSNTWCPRAPEEAVHLDREYRRDRKRMTPTAHNIDAVIAVINQRVDKGETMRLCGFG